MKRTRTGLFSVVTGVLVIGMMAGCSTSGETFSTAKKLELENEAVTTVASFKAKDPGIDKFLKDSAGYVVFPGIGKGGLIVGAAHGNGVVYEKEMVIGHASLAQGSIGLQIGGQAMSELVFFENKDVFNRFKKSEFEMSGQVSAVAVNAGAAAKTKYRDGVAVFVISKAGLMAEASIAGQKLTYVPNK